MGRIEIEFANPELEAFLQTQVEACRAAILIGDLPQVQNLLHEGVAKAIDDNILDDGDSVLSHALASGNAELVRLVLKLEKIATTVAVWNNIKLKEAVREGYSEIVGILLDFPQVFSLAEQEQENMEEYISHFITTKLNELRKSPVLELSPREERLCFYIARHLIRQNTMHEDLQFLLQIPGVRAMAHASVSFDKPNELLQLAIELRNDFAREQLLTIPAVKKLAEIHNFYQNMDEDFDLNYSTRHSEEELSTPKAALFSDLKRYCNQQERQALSIFSNRDIAATNLEATKHLMEILDGKNKSYNKELLTPFFKEQQLADLVIKWQIQYDLCFDSILCEQIPVEARPDAELSDYNSANNHCSDYSFSDGDYSDDETELMHSVDSCSGP